MLLEFIGEYYCEGDKEYPANEYAEFAPTLILFGSSHVDRLSASAAKAKRPIVSTEKVVLQTVSSAKQRLEDLPPSAKLVYKTLEFEGKCIQKELAKETRLSARTVRYAISRLAEEELIEQQVSFRDARQKLIRLRSNP